jgi:3-phosphoinositide dependent protein kinase-1
LSSGRTTKKLRRDTFVGTALYVSPEMLQENKAGPESDYWALGIIIYRLTFGKPPFEGAHENVIFQKILNRDL